MKAFQGKPLQAMIAGGLLALLAVAVAALIIPQIVARPPALEIILPTPTPVPSVIVVHMAGEVRQPGVYSFVPGTRLEDAIAAAGGLTPEADGDGVNRAQVVQDGQRYFVPARGAAQAGPTAGAAASSGLIDVNTATSAELETISGIGPELARRIIAYRQENGPYQRIEDLLNVSGIGPTLLERLRPHVIIQ